MIDVRKQVFLAPSCSKDQKTLEHVLKILNDHKFPDKNIVKNIDMDLLHSGDYLIRCLHDQIQLYEIQLTLPFGYTTNLVQNLSPET